MTRSLWIGALLVALVSAPAAGDRVWLKNGNHLEGEVDDNGDGQVAIRSALGTLKVPKEMVVRVERRATVETVVEDALSKLSPTDAKGRYQLALWCAEQGADTLARHLFEEVIAIAPDHADARRALGYRYWEGRWVTEEEFRDLRGEVHFRGAWVTPEERASILAMEGLAAERRRLESQQAAQQAQLQAQIAALQLEAARLSQMSYYYGYYGGGGPVVAVPFIHPHLPVHHRPFHKSFLHHKAPVAKTPIVAVPKPPVPSARRSGGHNVSTFRPHAHPSPQLRLRNRH